MAFRGGRGRGRGGFGRGIGYNSTQQPFTLFPEDVALPDRKCVTLNDDFVRWNHKLQMFFANSPYFVEDSTSQDCQNCDIERYSDSLKPRKNKRKSLSDYIKLGPGYFPQDLVKGPKTQTQTQTQKKVKWDAGLDGKRLDFLEQLEKKAAKGDKEKEKNEDEEEEDGEEEDEEYSTDGDYEQNQDFDDDDDDFNDNDDGDDEPFY